MCIFSVDGLRIGQVPFEVTPDGFASRTGPSIKSAFASYASKDRRRVLARVQGIEKLGVRVFMDVRDLKSGDPYPTDLLMKIETSDCQSAFKFDPVSASNFDPLERRVLAVALAPSELVGVAETVRARVGA